MAGCCSSFIRRIMDPTIVATGIGALAGAAEPVFRAVKEAYTISEGLKDCWVDSDSCGLDEVQLDTSMAANVALGAVAFGTVAYATKKFMPSCQNIQDFLKNPCEKIKESGTKIAGLVSGVLAYLGATYTYDMSEAVGEYICNPGPNHFGYMIQKADLSCDAEQENQITQYVMKAVLPVALSYATYKVVSEFGQPFIKNSWKHISTLKCNTLKNCSIAGLLSMVAYLSRQFIPITSHQLLNAGEVTLLGAALYGIYQKEFISHYVSKQNLLSKQGLNEMAGLFAIAAVAVFALQQASSYMEFTDPAGFYIECNDKNEGLVCVDYKYNNNHYLVDGVKNIFGIIALASLGISNRFHQGPEYKILETTRKDFSSFKKQIKCSIKITIELIKEKIHKAQGSLDIIDTLAWQEGLNSFITEGEKQITDIEGKKKDLNKINLKNIPKNNLAIQIEEVRKRKIKLEKKKQEIDDIINRRREETSLRDLTRDASHALRSSHSTQNRGRDGHKETKTPSMAEVAAALIVVNRLNKNQLEAAEKNTNAPFQVQSATDN